jgi:hypothetical protein
MVGAQAMERRNILVCSFDHQSPRISAYEIHEWMHYVLHAAEARVNMIQIDGPQRQVFIKFVDVQYAHDIFHTKNTQLNINTPAGKCRLSE